VRLERSFLADMREGDSTSVAGRLALDEAGRALDEAEAALGPGSVAPSWRDVYRAYRATDKAVALLDASFPLLRFPVVPYPVGVRPSWWESAKP
jgi:hypothetical protein